MRGRFAGFKSDGESREVSTTLIFKFSSDPALLSLEHDVPMDENERAPALLSRNVRPILL